MDWRKRKKELDKKYEYFWNNVGINGIDSKKEKVVVVGFPPKKSIGDVVTLQNHISYWTDKSGKILVELEEGKRVATLKDLLVETYDIFVEGNIYFCVPKNGMINQDYEYEERDIAELNCEIGQVDGFNTDELELTMVSSTGIVALTTAWRPPVIENPELPQGRIMEWTDKKGITDNAGMNSGADT